MNPGSRKLVHALGALADVASEISSANGFKEVMQASLHTLLGTLAITKGAIARLSTTPSQLKIISAKGADEIAGLRIPVEPAGLNLLIDNAGVIDLAGPDRAVACLLERAGGRLAKLGARIALPMTTRGSLVGLILVSAKFSGEDYDAEDIEIMTTMARHIGVAIYNHRLIILEKRRAEENKRLYKELRETYKNTIKAFAAAIDLKDAYTKGHSERVARYAESIAAEMGITGPELEHIAVAGYLHDIGKIVVDRAIINNPKPLSEREFKELNSHVVTGYEILSNINHPWNKIAYMTKCHHERVDGRGYPQGLRGDQIPLGARIVTVADSFDAMMTDRPYRSRLKLDHAVTELKRNSGHQFDPSVIGALGRILLAELNGERPRVFTATAGRDYDRASAIQELETIACCPPAGFSH